MTDKIRQKVEALVQGINNCKNETTVASIRNWQQFKDVEKALRPSRQEIADYLYNQILLEYNIGFVEDVEYLKYAIEELRK